MKAGCLTNNYLEMQEEGSSCVHSHGVANCIWYNDQMLWSGGYNLSGSKLNLWVDTHGVFLF